MKKDLEYYLNLRYPHTVDEYTEDGQTYYSLEIPDLPGCGASGKTYNEALNRLNESKELWIEESLNKGLSVPEPVSDSSKIKIIEIYDVWVRDRPKKSKERFYHISPTFINLHLE